MQGNRLHHRIAPSAPPMEPADNIGHSLIANRAELELAKWAAEHAAMVMAEDDIDRVLKNYEQEILKEVLKRYLQVNLGVPPELVDWILEREGPLECLVRTRAQNVGIGEIAGVIECAFTGILTVMLQENEVAEGAREQETTHTTRLLEERRQSACERFSTIL